MVVPGGLGSFRSNDFSFCGKVGGHQGTSHELGMPNAAASLHPDPAENVGTIAPRLSSEGVELLVILVHVSQGSSATESQGGILHCSSFVRVELMSEIYESEGLKLEGLT